MAGYFRVLAGRNYDGSHKGAVELYNGEFVTIQGNSTVAKTAAATDTVLRVAEKTSLWGKKALVLDVVSIGDNEVYMVENEWDGESIKDTSMYKSAEGALIKMKRPLPSEQVIVTVADALYSATAVGALLVPAANGALAAKA